MKKINLTLKPSDEYLDYGFEEVDNLFEIIDKYEDLLVSIKDLNLRADFNNEDLISSFSQIFTELKSNNIVYKWVQRILKSYKSYWIEHEFNLNGSDYILFHSRIVFSIINVEGKQTDSFEKSLIDLIQYRSSEEIITSIQRPIDTSTDMPLNEIEKIKSILLEEEMSGRALNFNTVQKLFKQNGYKIISKFQNRVGRFEIKVNNSYFALSSNEGLEHFLDSRNVTIEFTVGYFNGHKIKGLW